MTEGWIKIDRSFFRHWAFQNPQTCYAIISLLAGAAYCTTTKFFNGRLIELKRGEVPYSERELARTWNFGRQWVRDFLKRLERNNEILRRKANDVSILKLVKYDLWTSSAGDIFSSEENQQITRPISNESICHFDICQSHSPLNNPQNNPVATQRQPSLKNKIKKKEKEKDTSLPPISPLSPKEEENKKEKEKTPAAYVDVCESVSASKAPTLDAWCAYAIDIGWEYPEEYESAWKYFEKTKTVSGYWKDKFGRVISNWKLQCEASRDYHAQKAGRKRANYRSIDDCMADGIEPLTWRKEYAEQFNLPSADSVSEYYPAWIDLVETNYSLACLILARCLKHSVKDRIRFKTQYRREIEPQNKIRSFTCVNCNYSFSTNMTDEEMQKFYCPNCAALEWKEQRK